MIAAPVYLYDQPGPQRPAQIRRVEGPQTVWTLPIPAELTRQSAQLGLGQLWMTLCPTGGGTTASACETWQINLRTGERLNNWPGELWTAQAAAVVLVTDRSRSFDALDVFTFQATVVQATGVRGVTGQLSARPDCGSFDVLGLRWMGETLRLSVRDRCGLWTKGFGGAS
ncbi:hypothetical protein [Deinococcus radiotolerans]|uniref:Uncharacterized protein n=1 Tax=Deinococcus radiotolerans TaxID=1309407 RepID=A0ABQ2FR43_9DEIO|nr:hypothetical protein [Deinococcus radiotolerans]GGL18703.1 hypothetical protein GCM10010844_41980 [Deinococcus radiotolerans]